MRIIAIVLISAAVGVSIGGAAAYIETRSDRDVASLQVTTSGGVGPLVRSDEDLPRVEVDDPHFHFGTMQRGTTKSHEFIVRNVGTAPLTLRVGESTCKCTVGDVDRRPVPPGGSTPVRLQWDSKTDSGPFRQSAIIHTNDPLHSQLELSIEGEIIDATGVSPPEFMFDKITAGESKSAEVYVMAMLQDHLEVSEAEISDPAMRDMFDVRIEPAAGDELPNPLARDGVRITLTAKPGLPVGRLFQWLSVHTNLHDAEKLEIPLVGRVVGDISVRGINWSEERGALNIGRVKSSEGRSERVNLMVRGEGAADVTFQVESTDPPELRVTIGEPKQFRDTLVHVPVEIEVPAGTRPMVRLETAQGDEGRVVLSTTHPKIKELSLGVRFTVER